MAGKENVGNLATLVDELITDWEDLEEFGNEKSEPNPNFFLKEAGL